MNEALALNLEHPFVFQTPETYRELVSKLSERAREILRSKKRTAEEREYLVRSINSIHSIDESLTPEAERVVDDLDVLEQEASVKEQWNTWDYIKNAGAQTWEFVKAHPFLVGSAVLALTVGGAYYTGYLDVPALWLKANSALQSIAASANNIWASVTGSIPESVTGAVDAAKNAAGSAMEAAKDSVGTISMPEVAVPPVVPPAPSIPGAFTGPMH